MPQSARLCYCNFMILAEEREHFDALLEGIIEELPAEIAALLDEVPLVVDDEPTKAMLKDLGMDEHDLLCGLHWGIALTERSVQQEGNLPDRIWLFREPIMELAGWWRGNPQTVSAMHRRSERLFNQIRITLLHEIGHHFGLDEQQLAELGYA